MASIAVGSGLTPHTGISPTSGLPPKSETLRQPQINKLIMPEKKQRGRDTNPDPLTGEPGSHPVGTGVGAAGGGAAGAAIGAIGGPVGSAVGAVIGAVAGGLAGKGVAEAIDPTAEDAFWREQHGKQSFARKDRGYDEYAPAYRAGFMGYEVHGVKSQRFEDAEPHLREDYERWWREHTAAQSPGTIGTTPLAWEEARPAARAAWDRVHAGQATRKPVTEEKIREDMRTGR